MFREDELTVEIGEQQISVEKFPEVNTLVFTRIVNDMIHTRQLEYKKVDTVVLDHDDKYVEIECNDLRVPYLTDTFKFLEYKPTPVGLLPNIEKDTLEQCKEYISSLRKGYIPSDTVFETPNKRELSKVADWYENYLQNNFSESVL